MTEERNIERFAINGTPDMHHCTEGAWVRWVDYEQLQREYADTFIRTAILNKRKEQRVRDLEAAAATANRHRAEDWSSDHDHLEQLLRQAGCTEEEIYPPDQYSCPSIPDLADMLVKKLTALGGAGEG